MADLAFKDKVNNYCVVDVKTHREGTAFNMPNLTSVDRLARFYEDDANFFVMLMVKYAVVGTKVTVQQVHFVPIEHLKWDCLTLGALGTGQIQIADSKRIEIDPSQKRRAWMLEFCASNTVRFTYTSLVTPNSVVDFDLLTHAWQLHKQDEIPSGYDSTQYESKRMWATAPDGVKVPISLVYRKGFAQLGPLLLYGYGSYGSPVDPAFNANRLSLLDRGVACAIAHIRGGNEMGRQWYDNGKLMNKRNTFTDFIACAEHLIALGYTSPDRLAIQGKSAGGLLVGAAMTMRPDLFCSVIADVPFVDVISTMSDASIPLTAQEWEQWGNPADKAFYNYMKSYSPYDNIRETNYPALLLKAGWVDPRVQYWEPAKFAAKLREMKTDSNPLLLKTNMNAGHFGSSGRFDFLKEIAFDFAFVLDQFDVAL